MLAPGREDGAVRLGILGQVIGFRMRRIMNYLSRGFEERVRSPELKPGLFSLLGMIAANPGLSQAQLSAEVGLDKATLVVMLDNLEALGWARRMRAADDRRRHALYITRRGEKALSRLYEAAVENEAEVHAALTPEEQEQLCRLLDKMYSACFNSRRES